MTSTVVYVVVNEGVTNIGEYAFYGCQNLQTATIASSVSHIRSDSFRGCTALTSVSLLSGLTTVSWEAFYGCTALTSISLPSTVTVLGGYVFDGCTKLASVELGSIVEVGQYDFHNCTSLTSVTIPSTSTLIRQNAFQGCTSLTSVTIPSGVTSIGDRAFHSCTALTSVTIPSGVNSIGFATFNGCTALTSVNIPNSVTTIGDRAFIGCTALTSVTIPSSVTSIGKGAFANCTALTSVTIPSGVTSVGDYAFQNCTSLKTLTIGDGVQLGASAFKDCNALKKASFGTGLTSDVTSISGVFSMSFVDDGATTTALTEVSELSGCRFLRASDGKLHCVEGPVSASLTNVSNGAVNIVGAVNGTGDWGYRLSPDHKTLYIYGEGDMDDYASASHVPWADCITEITAVEIDSGITSVGAYAFSGAVNLTSVTIPDGVTKIGAYAFEGCAGLTSVAIPSSVTTIGTGAFCAGAFTVSAISDQTYSGSALTPKFTVTWNSSDLVLGTDYTVVYSDNVHAGTATVTVTGAGKYSGEKIATFTILKKGVDVPTAKENLKYDGNTLTGVASGDLYDVAGGSAVDAGSYTAVVTLKDADDYQWNTTFSGEIPWSIAKRSVTLTSQDCTVTYDGQVHTVTIKVSGDGFASCDTVTYKATERTNVTKDLKTTFEVVWGTVDEGNYSVTKVETGKITIEPLQLVISGTSVSGKVYDGTTAAAVSVGSLTNLVSGDSVTVTASGAFGTKDFGTGKSVTVTYSISGASAGNYLAPAADTTLTADVAKLQLEASGTIVSGKTYDGALTADVAVPGVLTNLVSGDTVTLEASAAFGDASAGAGKVVTVTYSIKGDSAGNYLAPADYLTTADVAAKQLTVSGSTTVSKTYDGSRAAKITVGTVTGILDADKDYVTVTPSGVFDTKDVGSYKEVAVAYTLSGDKAANYAVSSQTLYDGKITAKTLTINVNGTKPYDGSVFEYQITDANTDDLVDGASVWGTIATLSAISGTYTKQGSEWHVTVALQTSDGIGNYKVTFGTVELTITGEKVVTVTPVSGQSKTYGDSDPVLSYTWSAPAGVTPVFTGALTRASGDAAGTYEITVGTLTLSAPAGYTLEFTSGVLFTIEQKALTAADFDVDTGSVTYTGSAITKTITSSLTEGTDYTVTYYDNVNAGAASVVISGENNYTGTLDYGFTIDPKTLTVVSSASSRSYDGTTAASVSVTSVDGVVTGDDVTVSATGTFASKDVGSHAITVTYTLSGTAAGNYAAAPAQLSGSITPKALSITGTTVRDKVYDGTDTAIVVTGSLYGLVSGETVDITATGTFADANAGLNKSVTVTYDLHDDNYTLDDQVVYADITAKALSISGSKTVSKTYDGNRIAEIKVGKVSGQVSGETVKVTATGLFDTKDVGTGKVVAVIYSVDSSNYTLAGENLTDGAISQRTLTINVDDMKIYDGNVLEHDITSADADGLVSGASISGTIATVIAASGTYTKQGAEWHVTMALQTSDGIGNYNVVFGDVILEITGDSVIIVTPVSGQHKTYGESDPTVITYKVTASQGVTPEFSGALERASGEDAGTYVISIGTLKLTAPAGYTLEFTSGVVFTIDKKTVTSDDFTVDTSSVEYSGKAVTKTVTSSLTEGTDYTVNYSDNLKAGTATMTVSGMKNYNGSVEYTFEITKKGLVVSVDDSKVYDGSVLTHTLTDADADGLVSGASISGAIATLSAEPGTYTAQGTQWLVTVTITTTDGVENYDLSFGDVVLVIENNRVITVTPVSGQSKIYLDSDPVLSYTWDAPSGVTPAFSGALSRATGKDVGTYEITLGSLHLVSTSTFDASKYTLSFTEGVTFEITPKDVTEADFDVDTGTVTYTGLAFTKTVTSSLKLGTEYTVTYYDNVNAGTARIVIAGVNNYGSSVEYTFTILKRTVDVPGELYYIETGSRIDFEIPVSEWYTETSSNPRYGTEPGTYTYKLQLRSPANCVWSDETFTGVYHVYITLKSVEHRNDIGKVDAIVSSTDGIRADYHLVVTGTTDVSGVQKYSYDGTPRYVYTAKFVDDDGNEVQITGTITLSLLVPGSIGGSTPSVYQVSDGSAVKMSATASGSYVTVQTDSLSEYVLVTKESSGSDFSIAIVAVLVFITLLLVTAFVLSSRREEL